MKIMSAALKGVIGEILFGNDDADNWDDFDGCLDLFPTMTEKDQLILLSGTHFFDTVNIYGQLSGAVSTSLAFALTVNSSIKTLGIYTPNPFADARMFSELLDTNASFESVRLRRCNLDCASLLSALFTTCRRVSFEFVDSLPRAWPSVVQAISDSPTPVEKIELFGAHLTSDFVDEMRAIVGQDKQVKHLVVGQCLFDSVSIDEFLDLVATGVHSLEFRHNTVANDMAGSIARLMREAVTLKRLRLSHSGLHDDTFSFIVDAIRDGTLVEELDISDNDLTDLSILPMMEAINVQQSLSSLNVERNHLSVEGMAAFALLVEKNNSLEELFFCDQKAVVDLTLDEPVEKKMKTNKEANAQRDNYWIQLAPLVRGLSTPNRDRNSMRYSSILPTITSFLLDDDSQCMTAQHLDAFLKTKFIQTIDDMAQEKQSRSRKRKRQ